RILEVAELRYISMLHLASLIARFDKKMGKFVGPVLEDDELEGIMNVCANYGFVVDRVGTTSEGMFITITKKEEIGDACSMANNDAK
ncbi:MAG: hypothetical protein QXG97_05570, partial [Nitrososphaerota archaeon]